MRVRGIDTDNYDGAVSVDRFRHLFDRWDVRFNIIGTQVGSDGRNYTKVQTQNSLDAGLRVPYHYEFTYFNAGDFDRMRWAASFGRPVLLDEETDTHGWSAAQVEDRIGDCREILIREGQWGGHYTAPGFWHQFVGNSQAFAGDPLWLATWPFSTPGQAVLPPADYLPPLVAGATSVGGMKLIAWQYADTCYDEPGFDLNCMDLITEEDYVMANPVWATWKDRPDSIPVRNYLLFATPTGNRKDWVESAAQEDALRAAGIVPKTGVKRLTLEQLKQFAGSPEPDAP